MTRILSLSFAFLFTAFYGFADTSSREYIVADYTGKKVHLVNPDGTIKHSYYARNANDVWILADNTLLFNDGNGVKRLHPDGRIIWEYRSLLPPEENEIHSCQLLDNGNVLIAENGRSRIIEVDSSGQIVKEILVPTETENMHMRYRMCRRLPNGNTLIVLSDDQEIREYDPAGTLVRTVSPPRGMSFKKVHAVTKLPNGNLLISTGAGRNLIEINEQDQVVWRLDPEELKQEHGVQIDFICGLQRLKNGNTVLAVYQGNYQVVEVSPDNEVIAKLNIPGADVVTAIHVREPFDAPLR